MSNIQAAAYYFPNYHRHDQRNDVWYGHGWSEWDLLQEAKPRFEGHHQPREPLWGYEDESDPQVMARKIDAAADHGLTAFIFDWYWYEDGPYLEAALEKGFLKAPNNDRLKFSIMWANHDWTHIHPHSGTGEAPVLSPGALSLDAFRQATDRMIERYFPHPSYWRVEGGLYVSFYQISKLIEGFGGVEATRAALAEFRERVRHAGLGELHLNAVLFDKVILAGEAPTSSSAASPEQLGFDSVTSYVWIHHQEMRQFPTTKFPGYAQQCIADWSRLRGQEALRYIPNVTVGWDPSPRTNQAGHYDDIGYPYTPILVENSPVELRRVVAAMKTFLAESNDSSPQIFTINAWNEWTEGSYLEPDTVNGFAFLEAIRDTLRVTEDSSITR
ncbi:glycosyltransferase WbsX family protein [Synoicihabitans lomoniglobus]|uniref:Glycoside hydrolase family 99-like domain-containing protein n=1 Tax=Synoicihabitans lomoniglobus TaxID=2909285 RepID=A0AAF0A080_9BACT|nr:glycoside hydrolase family 99-like domain-containing protein [Opitutaceae bacterium LMO-M01]WED64057.1 glycoside hydrolase family 99-like domain-containing protein [Opitutaceae bacterium LMO-M01]